MRQEVIKELELITDEEKRVLSGEKQKVVWDIYSSKDKFEVDAKRLIRQGEYLSVRKHCRFVDFPEHGHNYIEILYVCQGTIANWIEGERIVMEAGDILFLNKEVKHSIEEAGIHDIGLNFMALPEFFDIPLGMLNKDNILAEFLVSVLRNNDTGSKYLYFKLGHEPVVDNLMENIALNLFTNEKNHEMINQYTMGLVFLQIINRIETAQKNTQMNYHDILIETTMRYINQHYRDANLTDLAEDLNQSLSVLSRTIKQETGHTFKELLQEKRFEKASMFLSETDLPIADIMVACGYENSSYFYRKFKEKYQISPKEYRKQSK